MSQSSDKTAARDQSMGATVPAAEIVLALGTFGNAVAAYLAERFPAIEPFMVGIDGEINRRESDRGTESMTVSTGSQAVWDQVRHFSRHRILKNDPLLTKVELPPRIGPGAARSRLAGGARYQIKRPQFVIRVKNTVAAALGELKGESLRQRQAMIRVHVITTSVSGSGAGYCPTAILDAIVAIQELAPTAHIFVTLHLVGPTCLRGLGPTTVDKFFHNTHGLIQELVYLQSPENLFEFAKNMEVFWDESRGQLIDEIIDYHGANSRNVAFTVEETFARVSANIRAAFDSTLAGLRVERDACNRRVRGDWTPCHVVSSVQAKIACIPATLPKMFADQWLTQALAPTLAKADVSKLSTEAAREILKATDAYEASVGRHFHQVASTFVDALKGQSSAELESDFEALTASLDRKLERTGEAVLEHYAGKVASQFERVLKNLSRRIANINGLHRVAIEVARQLNDEIERTLADANAIERELAAGPPRKRGFFSGRSVNWFVDFVNRRTAVARLKTTAGVLLKYAQAVASSAARLEALADSLRELAVESHSAAAEAVMVLAKDSASIVAASEIDGLNGALTRYLTERGESLPLLPLEGLLGIRGGSVAVVAVLRKMRERVAAMVRRQLGAETLSSFASTMSLRFDLEAWLRDTLATHGGSSPLVAALLPDAEDEKTIIVAAGADFASVEKVLREAPRLGHELEAVPGREMGIVMVLRGHDGAPIQAMGSYALSCSRAESYRRHHPHLATAARLTLDETVASSGFLLKAFGTTSPAQVPRVASPEAAPPIPATSRTLVTSGKSNGADK